jgi:hypothetical protein
MPSSLDFTSELCLDVARTVTKGRPEMTIVKSRPQIFSVDNFQFEASEIAHVLLDAELEMRTRGFCTRHTSLPSGEVCGVGAINAAVFGHPDGQACCVYPDLERRIALRQAVAQAMGFSHFMDLHGFNDRQSSPEPILELFVITHSALVQA